MKQSYLTKLTFIALLICLSAIPVFAQNTANAPAPVQAADTASQDKEVAIYGEVQSANSQSGVLAVQYYDYDSDSEKTADIVIGVDSKIENVAAIEDIKKGDWVDVTYVVRDGKNAAKVVTVEKEEAPATDEEAPQPAAPATNTTGQ